MKRSTERILTTHVGSLPRPADLRAMWAKKSGAAEDEAALQTRLRSAIGEVVLAQKSAGIDIPNDGEFGKPMRAATDRGAWGNYIFDRLSGFTPTSAQTIAPDTAAPGAAMRIVGVRWEQREFAEFYADTGLGAPSTAAAAANLHRAHRLHRATVSARPARQLEARRQRRRHRRSLRQRHRPRQPGDVLPRSEQLLSDH